MYVYASDGLEYSGPVHVFLGVVYSGKTRTPSSRRLLEVPDAPAPTPYSLQKTKMKRPKA